MVSLKAFQKKHLVVTVTFFIVVGIICITTLNNTATAYGFKDDSLAQPEKVKDLANRINDFSISLYREIIQKESGNIFFSPLSIEFALVIAYEGAKGKTKEEMERVLNLPSNETARRSSFARIFNLLNKNGEYELSLANALWIQKGYPILEEYRKTIERYYPADVYRVDFVNDPDGAVSEINEWVSERTKGKINKILNGVSRMTRVIITNAIYFKGKWLHQFEKSKTQLMEFYVTKDKAVKVQMMHTKEEFPYTETKDFQLLEMPYKGNEISMIVILPKKVDGLKNIEEKINASLLRSLLSKLSEREVIVYFPKFKFEKEYDIAGYLQKMGMKYAFEPGLADFSGISGRKDIFISKIKHKAYVKVDEEGTEAAAATVVVGVMGAVPVRETIFRADHPFIFFIIDKRTGVILFMGRVVNPVKG